MMNTEQPLQHQTTSPAAPMSSTTPSHSERRSNEVVVETVDSDDDEEKEEAPPRDAIEENVAMIINLALYFFGILLIGAVVMILLFLSQFGGVLVLVIVSLLVTITASFTCFMTKAMREDKNWKPVQTRISKLKAMATAAIVQEVRHFRTDWYEHLQLTDGTCDNNDDLPNDDDDPIIDSMLFDEATIPTMKKKRKGGKSIMFKFVKPFLKLRKLRRRKTASNERTEDVSDYVPPLPPTIV